MAYIRINNLLISILNSNLKQFSVRNSPTYAKRHYKFESFDFFKELLRPYNKII